MQKQASLLPFYEDFRGENTDWSIPLNSYHAPQKLVLGVFSHLHLVFLF